VTSSALRLRLEAAFHTLAQEVADAIEQSAAPERFDQNNSPLGKRRHLDVCRRGELASEKVGKSVFVTRVDMEKYLATHRRAVGAATSDEDAAAAALGLGKA